MSNIPWITKIQSAMTEKTKSALKQVMTRTHQHYEASHIENHPLPSQKKTSSFVQSFFQQWTNPQAIYFKGYVEGCEEARKVNYAQGYFDGFNNGQVIGGIKTVTALSVAYTADCLYQRFFR